MEKGTPTPFWNSANTSNVEVLQFFDEILKGMFHVQDNRQITLLEYPFPSTEFLAVPETKFYKISDKSINQPERFSVALFSTNVTIRCHFRNIINEKGVIYQEGLLTPKEERLDFSYLTYTKAQQCSILRDAVHRMVLPYYRVDEKE